MISDSVRASISKLNGRFADVFGRSPATLGSLPMRAWFWSPELTYVGLNEKTHQYERYRQLELEELDGEERWVTATWTHQGGQTAWEEKYGEEIAWPDQGLYISDNGLWCRPGQVPGERETDLIISIYRHNQERTPQQRRDDNAEGIIRANNVFRQHVSDVIDAIPDHNPGRRGQHVSFGGYDVPLISTEETIQ